MNLFVMIMKESIKKKKQKLLYLLKDAIWNIWNSRVIVVSSVVIVAAGLSLFGFYMAISMNVDYIGHQFESQYALIAYIEKGTPEDRISAITDEINQLDNVNNVTFISEEQAIDECKKLFDEDYSFLDGLEEDNPLRASFEVTVNDLQKAEELSNKIKNISDVVWVKNNQDLVTNIISATAFLRKGSFWLMLLFGIVALFIVSNTIKLLVTNRKEDILTMRYMGADNSFIIEPFIFEGALIGVIGAVIAYGISIPGYSYCIAGIRTHLPLFIELYNTGEIALKLFIYFMVFGLLLGIMGSVYSVKRYIKA